MSSFADRRRRLPRGLALACVVSAVGAAAVLAAASESASALEPQALARANGIQVHVNARYRGLPGRKLRVTEVTTTGIVESLSIIEDPLEPARVVPADNGVYFALCRMRARCPYQGWPGAWPPGAFRPRRMALELAVRTFSQTSAALVVVALPTSVATWIVFERDDLLAEVGAPLRKRLTAAPSYADEKLRTVVDRLTRRRTVVPIEIVPIAPGRRTFTAIAFFGP
jgi:hypothetical protein